MWKLIFIFGCFKSSSLVRAQDFPSSFFKLELKLDKIFKQAHTWIVRLKEFRSFTWNLRHNWFTSNSHKLDSVDSDSSPTFMLYSVDSFTYMQMRPTSLPQETLKRQRLKTGTLRFRRIGCPKGTVPIQRASKKQLAWMKHEHSASMNSSHAAQSNENPTPSGYLVSFSLFMKGSHWQ